MAKRISLKDVATRAGVAPSTASQALRGVGRIHSQTAQTVRKAAQDLGYTANPTLSRLAAKQFRGENERTGETIVFANQTIRTGANTPLHYSVGIKASAKRLGYRVASYTLTENGDLGRARRSWERTGVRAVIFGQFQQPEAIQKEDWSRFAVVCCGGYHTPSPFYIVKADVAAAAASVFQHIYDAGYRRIGLAPCRHKEAVFDDHLRHGVLVSMRDRLLPAEYHMPVFLGQLGDERAFLQWVETHKPEAILGFNAFYYKVLKNAGHRIPFASLNHNFRAGPQEQVATILEPMDEIGITAVERIDTLLKFNLLGKLNIPRTSSICGRWRPGKSLPTIAMQ